MGGSFEDERRFLGAITKSSGPFVLIGYDEQEQRYLLERAKEVLKKQDHHVDLQKALEAKDSRSLSEVKEAGFMLFESSAYLWVKGLEAIKKEEIPDWIEAIRCSPRKLFLSSTKKLTNEFGSLLKSATILDISTEKPWERPQRFLPWISGFLRSLGMDIEPASAKLLCESLQFNRQMIRTYLQAAAASHGFKGTLKLEGEGIEYSLGVWKWLDAIFAGNEKLAAGAIDSLLDEDPSAIPLVALLRQQWQLLFSLLEMDKSELAALSKTQSNRWQLAKKLGKQRLTEGTQAIAKTQFELKSSKDPKRCLLILLAKLYAIVK